MKKQKENQITLKDKKTYFCIPFKITGRNINLHKFIDYSNSPGWLVDNNKIDEWYFSGITQKNEYCYIYGKNFIGFSLSEILSYPLNKALSYLKLLINTLIILKQNNKDMPIMQLDNIYFLENDKVLFLPSNIFEKIKNIDNNYNFKNYSLINNPYLNKASEKISYNILIILYKLLSGIFPFDDNNEDELNNKIRNLKILPPKLINYKVKTGISNYIASLFKNNNFKHLELQDWQKYIEKITKEGLTEKTIDIDKEKYREEYKKQKEASQENYKKKIFWEKNNKKIFIISVSIILFGIVSFYLLKNFFRPRVIKGLSPMEVVETFYKSINKLDHITMEDCVIKKAGKSDINEVLSLYINQKQSIAYTGKSNLIFADAWDKKGRPEIDSPFYVYGILNIDIKEESSDPQRTYIVSYEKWGPVINENESDEKRVQFEGSKVKDRVFLIKYKKYWVINKIDRLEKNIINE